MIELHGKWSFVSLTNLNQKKKALGSTRVIKLSFGINRIFV
jgi:hypothetical protein